MKKTQNLLDLCFELTLSGVVLAGLLVSIFRRLDAEMIAAICVFLAFQFFFKLVFPVRNNGNIYVRIFTIACCCLFSWGLMYQAENTRAGWYRFHVLKPRVQAIVQHSPSYTILANEKGIITKCSDNITILTGYAPKELIGKNLTVLMRDGPAARHLIEYRKVLDQLRVRQKMSNQWIMKGELDLMVRRKDGQLIPVRIYAGCVRWSKDIIFDGDTDVFAILVPQ